MHRFPIRSLLVLAVIAAVLGPAQQALAFTDVSSSYWDYAQITYVTPWMSDYGSTLFKPTTDETRSYLCRTLVQMFDPNEPIDPSITFPDLPQSDPMYPFANVCTKKGWIDTYKDGSWAGGNSVPRSAFDQALTLAMNNVSTAIKGLQNIQEDNGTKPYSLGTRWAYMQIATYLELHYDHSDDVSDLQISTHMHRDEVAYSLWMAKHLQSWQPSNANTLFAKVSLPTLDTSIAGDNTKYQLTLFAMQQVGFPYIWGGEWNAKTPSGYCCGAQAEGGFDCSGFSWWVLKKNEDGYDAAQFHSAYPGWSLHERTSSDMAANATTQISYGNLVIGNLMFFASDGVHSSSHVDHVGIYVGNGWMMHSTSGGPQLETVASGWYHDHFVWGRALKSKSSLAPLEHLSLGAGETAAGPGAP
jgi:NlpC/P60 family